MTLFVEGFREALRLIAGGDPLVLDAAWRSLWISALAVLAAGALGTLGGLGLALLRFPGRGLLIALARAGMNAPTVLIGLLGYGLLSRRGPLGSLELLYSPWAVVMGEFVLALPIVLTWTQGSIRKLDHRVFETAITLGLRPWQRARVYLSEARLAIALAFLTAFARCFTELGIAMMLGGNIKERTRTLATATALETSRGDFARGMAMSLLLLLIGLIITLGLGWLNARRREEEE
ncbi:MAG: ABC transporter permease [Planctomycetes bacterium]|nr:ABC transporter permease [Planctomycetota bacterium]